MEKVSAWQTIITWSKFLPSSSTETTFVKAQHRVTRNTCVSMGSCTVVSHSVSRLFLDVHQPGNSTHEKYTKRHNLHLLYRLRILAESKFKLEQHGLYLTLQPQSDCFKCRHVSFFIALK